MADEDLLFSSTFDAETAENKTIRDTAFQAASVGRGMVGAHANALGGGLFAQGLARMAGWKTPAQRKAETISNILKGTSGLDRNDPKNLRAIAQKLLQQGLPGEAEKFMQRARTIETENRTFKLEKEKVAIQQGQLDLNKKTQSDANILAWEANGHTQQQINNQMFMFNERLGFDKSEAAYQQKQDAILNAIKREGMSLEMARFALAKNAEEFNQAQGLVSNERLQQALDIDEWYKKALVEQNWANIELSEQQLINSKYEHSAELDFKNSTLDYQKYQDSILNSLRTGEFDLATADQALRANAEAFKQTQTGVENEQWKEAQALNNFVARAQVAQGWADHQLNKDKYKHMVYVDDKNITINERAAKLSEDKQKFHESNTEIINQLSQGALDIDKARLLLQQNSFDFDKSRALVTDKQWLANHEINKLLADADVEYKKAQTAGKILENKAFPVNNQLANAVLEAEAFMKTVKVTSDGVMIFETDDDGNFTGKSHWATDADGDVLGDFKLGKEFGLTIDEKRIIDMVWKEYQSIYYTGGSLTEDAKWAVPESLMYDEVNNPTGLHKRPTFKEFTERTVERGGHGGHLDIVSIVAKAYGEEGSYQAHLEKEATLNRKPNEIILQNIDGISFAVPFSIEDLSKTHNIPMSIMNETAVFKNSPNDDKDSNAQIIAEITTLRDAYKDDSDNPEYIKYNNMLTDFVTGLTTAKDAKSTPSTEGHMTIEGTPTEVDDSAIIDTTSEAQVKSLQNQTKAAVQMTGITEADGGRWRPVQERAIKNRKTASNVRQGNDGRWYVWDNEGLPEEKDYSGVTGSVDQFIDENILGWYD